jgi:hypothetical protein
LRETLRADYSAVVEFDSRLVEAGFIDSMRDHYVRTFHVSATSYFLVTDAFPRLTPSSVPRGLTRASYELDLDLVPQISPSSTEVFRQLGVLI